MGSKMFDNKPGFTPPPLLELPSNFMNNTSNTVPLPDLYLLTHYLGKRFGCSYVIDIGCERGKQLIALHPDFNIVGIDSNNNIEYCRKLYPHGEWIEWNQEADGILSLDHELLKQAIIVCSSSIQHLNNTASLLNNLKTWLDYAPVAILTVPDGDPTLGAIDSGRSENQSDMLEWNLSELNRLLEKEGFNAPFTGLIRNSSRDLRKKTAIAVLENNRWPRIVKAPSGFHVVAVMTAYNEEDIIVPSIKHLISQGIDVYLIDNWSSDSTFDLANQFLGQGLIGIERFPMEGPSKYFNLKMLLQRKEEISHSIKADWFIHYDVDEERESPWPSVNLKDGIYHVDQCGFNCIDHTVIEFHPIDNNYPSGTPLGDYFKHYEFGVGLWNFIQIKAWKYFGQNISLADTGGHEVRFDQRRIYPYKFLLKHFPIRSEAHGKKKVFLERKHRWNPEEIASSWHMQYDYIEQGHDFLWKSSDLKYFDEEVFNYANLVERLTGKGILVNIPLDDYMRITRLISTRLRDLERFEAKVKRTLAYKTYKAMKNLKGKIIRSSHV